MEKEPENMQDVIILDEKPKEFEKTEKGPQWKKNKNLPEICPLCQKVKTKNNIKRHIKTHYNSFPKEKVDAVLNDRADRQSKISRVCKVVESGLINV